MLAVDPFDREGHGCKKEKHRMQWIAAVLLMALMANSAMSAEREESKAQGDQKAELAKPSPRQLEFADWELGTFIHFGISTFTGEGHGNGRANPKLFDPKSLDVRQWLAGAKAMGAKYAILTARHEDGFCMWPTKTTDYSVKSSPWKGGKGDVVREFVDACREMGIEPCLYFSPGYDAHHLFGPKDKVVWGKWDMSRSNQAEFIQRDIAQVTELITLYKPRYLWFDHNLSTGISKAVTKAAMELDPQCLVYGPQTCFVGTETGHAPYPLWNAVNTVDDTLFSRARATSRGTGEAELLETDSATGHPLGKFWRPRDAVTASPFGGWFWNSQQRKKVADGEAAVNMYYYRTVGLGANTTINLCPDNRGLVPDHQMAGAKAFGAALARQFGKDKLVAQTARVQTGDTVEVRWEKPRLIDRVVLMENIVKGQKIAKYDLEARVDGQWSSLTPNNISGFNAKTPVGFETIGHKKIDRVKPVTATGVRFRCLKAVAQPVEMRSLAVYAADGKQ